MQKIESTSDLEAICSSTKTRLEALIINATKLLTLTHILDFIKKAKWWRGLSLSPYDTYKWYWLIITS
jgi:hypothetical protein